MLLKNHAGMIFLSIICTANLYPSLCFSQVKCVYPPPDGANDRFIEMAQKHVAAFQSVPLPRLGKQAFLPEGNWRALVILIDFPNYRWDHSRDENFPNPDSVYAPQYFQEMLFSENTFADPFSSSPYTGSLRDFYLANSYGSFNIDGDVAGWFTAQNDLDYYLGSGSGFGSYPNNAQRLVEEAVAQAAAFVDFSDYDNDGNGVVDALMIVHAGPGAEYIAGSNPGAATQYLWSHFSGIQNMRVDNVTVSGYAMMPEDGAIGVFCHEFGHNLGLPDLYDSDGSSEGVGEWCLMGSGSWCYKSGDRLGTSPSHFSAWSRLMLGWATPVNFQEGETVRLLPIETSDNILVLRNASMPSTEYFLLENRQPLGFDQGLTRRQKDFSLSAPAGLLIYHIDETGSPSFDQRRLIDVEEASPYFIGGQKFEQLDAQRLPPNHAYLNKGNRGDNGDPFPGFASWKDDLSDFLGPRSRNRFDDSTVPSSRTNGGAQTAIIVSEISLDNLDVLCRIQTQSTTAITDGEAAVPEELTLSALPNPAYDNLRIIGRLPRENSIAHVRLYDVLGRELFSREIKTQSDGSFEWKLEKPSSLPAGIYFSIVQAGADRAVAKIILLH